MYNKNICCYYLRRYIITIFIHVIHESVFLIIRDDVNDHCQIIRESI